MTDRCPTCNASLKEPLSLIAAEEAEALSLVTRRGVAEHYRVAVSTVNGWSKRRAWPKPVALLAHDKRYGKRHYLYRWDEIRVFVGGR